MTKGEEGHKSDRRDFPTLETFRAQVVDVSRLEQAALLKGSFAHCCAYTPQLCRFFALQKLGRWSGFSVSAGCQRVPGGVGGVHVSSSNPKYDRSAKIGRSPSTTFANSQFSASIPEHHNSRDQHDVSFKVGLQECKKRAETFFAHELNFANSSHEEIFGVSSEKSFLS